MRSQRLFSSRVSGVFTGYQLLSIWCQLEQLVQSNPVEEPSYANPEQYAR